MKYDIIIAGVGGQGIISIAAAIGKASLKEGYTIKQSEIHGMSQRGGAVQSHLRISSSPIASDLISIGKADMIISLEPMEALRYLPYLSESGWLISSNKPFINITNYPDLGEVIEEISRIKLHLILDSETIALEAGALKSSNMVILGAASIHLPLKESSLEWAINELFSLKGNLLVSLNLKAFKLGREQCINI